MNHYYFLNRDISVAINDISRRGGIDVVTLSTGTIFESGVVSGIGQISVKMFNHEIERFDINIAFVTLVPERFINSIDGNAVDIFNLSSRNDYRIEHRSLRCNVVRNYSALSLWMHSNQSNSVNKDSEHINVFKYIPVDYHGIRGFLKDDYIISSDHKGAISGTKISYNNLKAFFQPNVIQQQCKFKVVNYINSAKAFKFTDLKKSMIGNVYFGSEIELGCEVKSLEGPQNTIKLTLEDGKKSRFLLGDIEIIYPNINSFNAPKCRDLIKGVIVKVSDNRRLSIPKNSKVKILDIKTVGTGKGAKQYAVVDYNNKNIYTSVKSLRVC